jgi:outer membrane lipoprotein-sorting protein
MSALKPILALITVLALTALVPSAHAQSSDTTPTLGIVEAMEAAATRFEGRIVAAELTEGRPAEATASVYEFRMLTSAGDILRIRVDAANGDILDVDGRGLMAARRPLADQPED